MRLPRRSPRRTPRNDGRDCFALLAMTGLIEVHKKLMNQQATKHKMFTRAIFVAARLNLPATSCGESPTVKENIYFIRSLTPLQATGNALAVQFIGRFCIAPM